MTFHHIVTKEEDGKTILALLKGHFRFSTRVIIYLKQQEDGILKNGVRAFSNAIVQTGDFICINLSDTTPSEQVAPENIPLSIIYEDDALIILDKPADMVIHPTHNYQNGTLSNGVAYHYQSQGLQGKIRPVSRLDRGTSGLVLFAKNAWVQDCLSNSKIHFEKKYLALTHGIWETTKGTLDFPIARVPGSTIERCVSADGDFAITHYTVLKTFENRFSLVEFALETGRTHQIRVHCKAAGHPIVGDSLYNSPLFSETLGLTHQALHSYQLSFLHPVAKQIMCFTAPLPADIRQAISVFFSTPI